MVTDIGLGVVVAVGVLLGLVAGMVVGWIASRRMGRKDFALQSEAILDSSRAANKQQLGLRGFPFRSALSSFPNDGASERIIVARARSMRAQAASDTQDEGVSA